MSVRNNKKGKDKNSDNVGTDIGAAFAAFNKEMYKKQLELFEQWNEMFKKYIPDPDESKVLTKIVTDHWKKLSDRIEALAPELGTPGPHMVDKQRKLIVDFLEDYNSMLKEFMASSQFASMVGAQLSKTMEQRKQYENLRDEVASNLGFPTKNDIRDIHESIYYLNKRFDDIERLLRKLVKEKRD
jgi:hypothetical protein